MTLTVQSALLIFLLSTALNGLIFIAVQWAVMKGEIARGKKDINNLGDKNRQVELKLFYVAMMTAPDEKKQEILNALVRRLT